MKIRKIEFTNHPVLGNLKLDFTDHEGKTVDTVIIAGENGTGKSLILNTIFDFSRLNLDNSKKTVERRLFEVEISKREVETLKQNVHIGHNFVNLEKGILTILINYSIKNSWGQFRIHRVGSDNNTYPIDSANFSQTEGKQSFNTIFSDVEINFKARDIRNVTSSTIDNERSTSEKSSDNLATQITQLLIDIKSIDAEEVSNWARNHPGKIIEQKKIEVRTKRFTDAFDYMFPRKKYKGIDTVNNQKMVMFEENGNVMSINDLSSGEKQIVFRGSFLLKDKKSAKGALILIDEPEISMHPTWQLKILTFFKKLFTDEGKQTSQLIIATHSPFIVHNSNRKDDKVIVLQKDDNGEISVQDHPKFYSWTREKIVESAFNVSHTIRPNKTNVFLEGETDEDYFNKAAEIFEISTDGVVFKWIGRINEKGHAENTGDKALNQARTFFLANEEVLTGKTILLYDNDTNKPEEDHGNLRVRKIRAEAKNDVYKIGIESILILPDNFNYKSFYNVKTKKDEYGAESTIKTLDKRALCDNICKDLSTDEQKLILGQIKIEIERLIEE